MLRKFKEAYPDYVPYEMGLDAGAYYDLKYVLPMFGIPNSDKWLYIDEDKKVQFAPVQQGIPGLCRVVVRVLCGRIVRSECLSQDGNTLRTKL